MKDFIRNRLVMIFCNETAAKDILFFPSHSLVEWPMFLVLSDSRS